MKNFLIDGIWQGPPDGFDVKNGLTKLFPIQVLMNIFNQRELFGDSRK